MVTVLIHTDTRYPVNRKIIRRAVSDTLKKNKVEDIDAEVSVAVVGGRKMGELSSHYFGDGQKHAVLTFALEEVDNVGNKGDKVGFVNPPDGVLRLGDVVLCWPYVLEEAGKDDILVDEEVYFLTYHGVEHLLGEHHE
jgi:rRNA maturation RNase YbeY